MATLFTVFSFAFVVGVGFWLGMSTAVSIDGTLNGIAAAAGKALRRLVGAIRRKL